MGNNCLICVKAQTVDFSPGVDSERPDNNIGNESSEKKPLKVSFYACSQLLVITHPFFPTQSTLRYTSTYDTK